MWKAVVNFDISIDKEKLKSWQKLLENAHFLNIFSNEWMILGMYLSPNTSLLFFNGKTFLSLVAIKKSGISESTLQSYDF